MNLELDDVQRELVAVTSDACKSVAAEWRTSTAAHRESLSALGEIGILGARHPEPYGSGLSAVEAVLSAFECGAALAPTALMVWADIVGPVAPEALTGTLSVTGSFDRQRGVSFGGHTDRTVLLEPGGAYLVDSETIVWEPVGQVDPTTPRGVTRSTLPTGAVAIAGADDIERWRWQFGILVAAHLVGVGLGALYTSVDYAKERVQFGRPIGSFQAVKHMLADSYTSLEMARCQVLTAALCWTEENPAAPDHATAAAVVAAAAAIEAAQTAIQVHGGMGFTAEAVPHLYYKRALQLHDDLLGAGIHEGRLLHRDLNLHG